MKTHKNSEKLIADSLRDQIEQLLKHNSQILPVKLDLYYAQNSDRENDCYRNWVTWDIRKFVESME